LPVVIAEIAERSGDAPALLADRELLSYRDLIARANRYARWALDRGLRTGDVVALLMPNRPEYVAVWLGLSSIGVVVALVNTHLTGRALAHAINLARPAHVVVAAALADSLMGITAQLVSAPEVWVDLNVDQYPDDSLRAGECRRPTIEDRALYIFTSGTTGLSKAANISHARLMQWSLWFAGMMDARPSDRMYNCLPMYHSVGGVVATGALLVAGGSSVIRETFSASRFWDDVARSKCTLFQYIGELCRYLVQAPPSSREARHHLRLACGNGLNRDVWSAFKARFQIPQILEFYASTEGNVSIFNVEGKPGALGRVPPYLARRFPIALVTLDARTGEPRRDEHGACIRAAPHEVGEAIGLIPENPANVGSRFEGYSDAEASTKKILRDVFEPGDAWFRTGDLMRADEQGYFYFVDRAGDTFRWKGENVAASEVAEVLCAFPGIRQANVYGVPLAGADGRAGMAAIVVDGHLDLQALRVHMIRRLPPYARPLFLRIRCELETTPTFKYTRNDLVAQAYDPTVTTDAIYFNASDSDAFIRVDSAWFTRIQAGRVRV
jgi:fatty-acyl-CoA synthase